MHADSGQQLRQPVSAQAQKQEAAEQVRHVDPFGAAERQQVSHRGKQDPRIAQRRVGNGVADIAAVEGRINALEPPSALRMPISRVRCSTAIYMERHTTAKPMTTPMPMT